MYYTYNLSIDHKVYYIYTLIYCSQMKAEGSLRFISLPEPEHNRVPACGSLVPKADVALQV